MNLTEIRHWASPPSKELLLGSSQAKAGALVGWLKNGVKDSYVSLFHHCVILIWDVRRSHSNVVVIFNVDGVIWKSDHGIAFV